MNLEQGIGHIIKSYGKLALKDERVIKLLENCGAFDNESNAVKFIIRAIISEGFMDRLVNGAADYDQIVSILWDNYGFDKELSKYIVRLIIIGLNPTTASRSVSEDTDSRMTFRGVPICGHIDTVRQKLESLGYTFIEYLPNGIVLRGEFAGKTGCEICIIGSAITHEAWKILVCFPEQESWYMLKKEYFQYKQILVDKYGKPDEYEYFEYPYQDGDGEELTALHNNKCSFQSFFKTDKGYITITIKSTDYILLDYEDNIGAELATNEEETKAKSDI